MSALQQILSAASAGIVGQDLFTNPNTYTWYCREGVTSICVVCIGGGGGAYLDTIIHGGNSSFSNQVTAGGGQTGSASAPGLGGSVILGIGGVGGDGARSSNGVGAGGGGAGGYAGAGGAGGNFTGNGGGGSGGGGGGGTADSRPIYQAGDGGSVGLMGQGTSGPGAGYIPDAGQQGFFGSVFPGASYAGGGAGSSNYGGSGGGGATSYKNNIAVIPGNFYTLVVGDGGIGYTTDPYVLKGEPGGVRIIWGLGRSFPSTRTGDE